MREHPAIGERILRAIPGMGGIARIVRHEHERFDGAGYPDGLVRRRDPDREPDHPRLRRVPRDDLRPPLPQGHAARGCRPRARRQRRDPVRPAGHRSSDRLAVRLRSAAAPPAPGRSVARGNESRPARLARPWPSRSPPSDLSAIQAERGPVHMHVGGVVVLDGRVDRDTVARRISERIHLIPRYTMKLDEAPLGLANPVWVDDPGLRGRAPRAPRSPPLPGRRHGALRARRPGDVRAARPLPPAVAAGRGRGACTQPHGCHREDAPLARGRPRRGGRGHRDSRPDTGGPGPATSPSRRPRHRAAPCRARRGPRPDRVGPARRAAQACAHFGLTRDDPRSAHARPPGQERRPRCSRSWPAYGRPRPTTRLNAGDRPRPALRDRTSAPRRDQGRAPDRRRDE